MHVYQRQIDPQGDDSLARIARRVPAGSRVLDVGCGSGALGAYLVAHKGCIVDGLTNNPDEAAMAAQSHREVLLVDLERDDLAARYAGRRYDVIVCADVLEHVRASEAVLRTLADLLAPAGRVLLSIPNVGHLGVQLSLAAGRFVPTYEGLLDATHVRFFDRHAVERLLHAAGLAALHLERVERNLAATEFAGIDFACVPAEVQRFFAAAPEATTYQFIVEAQPSTADATAAVPLPQSNLWPTRPQIELWPLFEAQVFWRGPQHEGYDEARSVKAYGRLDGSTAQILRFELPADAGSIDALRIDPCDRPALLRLHRVSVLERGSRAVLAQWAFELRPEVRSGQLDFLPGAGTADSPGREAQSLGADPWVEWCMASVALAPGVAACVELTLDAPQPNVAHAWGTQAHVLRRQLDEQRALLQTQASSIERLQAAFAQERHDRAQAEMRLQTVLAEQQHERGLWASRIDAAERQVAAERYDRSLAEQRLAERLTREAQWREQVAAAERAAARAHDERAQAEHGLRRMQAEAAVLTQRLEQLAAAESGLRQHLDDLKRSHSWRLTAPLRATVDMLRGLRQGRSSGAESSAPASVRSSVTPPQAPEPAQAGDPEVAAGVQPSSPSRAPNAAWAEQIVWSCDALRLGEGVIVAFGWLAARQGLVLGLELLGRDPAGTVLWRLPVEVGRPRPDVAQAHPQLPLAAHSGWWVYRALPTPAAASFALGLRWRAHAPPHDDAADAAEQLVLELPLPQAAAIGAADAESERIQTDPQPVMLVVDHAMGGGSASFARDLIDRLLTEAEAGPLRYGVVHLRFDVPSLSYRLEWLRTDGPPTVQAFHDWLSLSQALAARRWAGVHFNGGVSYPQPLALVQWLERQTAVQDAPLNIYVHDYHAACPSPFLLDADGRHCGIPQDLQRCRACLSRHPDAQVNLAGGATIEQWRAAFGRLLQRARSIVCFSQSSVDLLRRAYADLDSARLLLRPHAVAPFAVSARIERPRRRDPAETVTVVVVGHIGPHKGAHQVAALARAIERRGGDARLIVIGTIDMPVPASVTVTGAYEREQLPQLLAEHRAELAWLPSICPETFSFVVHELRALGLPLAAFDLGAQAEALRGQPRAVLLDLDAGADAWLDALLAFAAALRRDAAEPACSDTRLPTSEAAQAPSIAT